MSDKKMHVGAALFLMAVVVSPVLGGIRYSENGGIQQIWVTADAFTARSMSDGTPDYMVDPAAIRPDGPWPMDGPPLSGSAYYFGKDVDHGGGSFSHAGGVQENWWVQYEIPKSALPANFDLTGKWGFWIRGQVASAEEYGANPGGGGSPDMFWDSDWLFVNGHPYDLNASNPAEADWQTALSTANNIDDRVQQNYLWVGREDGIWPPHAGVRPEWTWLNTQQPDDREFMAKTFSLVDDKITFRIYEREAGVYNGRVDVICFARTGDPADPNFQAYTPTDAHYLASLPEPASVLMLVPGLFLLRRRS